MGRVRTAVTGVVLILACAVSLSAAVKTALTELPVTDQQHRAQLTERLTSADLREVSQAEQLRMARHLELGFREGLDWQSEFTAMSGRDGETLRKNLAQLMHVSLLEKVDRYDELSPQDRESYLDEQLDDLMSWQVFKQGMFNPGDAGNSLDDLIAIAGYVGTSLEQSDQQQRRRLMRFLMDAKNHVEQRGIADFKMMRGRLPGQ